MKWQPNRSKHTIARMVFSTFAFCLLPLAFCLTASAQEVVDKMVASVNGHELITYTDLLWQLALQPDTPIDTPRSEDLQRALNLLIDQRLIAEEAGEHPPPPARGKGKAGAPHQLPQHFPPPPNLSRG